jgi:hypothetical protein
VDWVFIDHPSYKRPALYADETGPYPDNQARGGDGARALRALCVRPGHAFLVRALAL